ncbi:MAG: hypothetical protein OEL78_02920 [Hyphomicrobiales bacterium]|nr:hypothetical protein [Hyphomicrobiales bacterium]
MGFFDIFKKAPAMKSLTDMEDFPDELPVHDSLRGHDLFLVHNKLRSSLCRMHDEFAARADLPALARSVIAGTSLVNVPPVGRLAG